MAVDLTHIELPPLNGREFTLALPAVEEHDTNFYLILRFHEGKYQWLIEKSYRTPAPFRKVTFEVVAVFGSGTDENRAANFIRARDSFSLLVKDY